MSPLHQPGTTPGRGEYLVVLRGLGLLWDDQAILRRDAEVGERSEVKITEELEARRGTTVLVWGESPYE